MIRFLGIALLILLLVILANTLLLQPSDRSQAEPVEVEVDLARVARNMSRAIEFQTVSFQPGTESDRAPFKNFIEFIQNAYPHLHEQAERVLIAEFTPLFIWQGRDTSLQPVLLTAHYDVVPVIPGTEDKWSRPPFSGDEVDGFIYGRGALDDKGSAITLLEAAEMLAAQGFTPGRTLYISLGHDEEIGGASGAGGVTRYLKDQGVRLAWTLDEGSFVSDGMMATDRPVAMINVAEKGWASLDVIASDVGGHSSMPPSRTAVGKLAEAIVQIQESPLPGGLSGVSGDMLDGLAPHLPFYQRVVVANRWLFGGLLERILGTSAVSNAMMRTTIAPTMLSASLKENVLPIEAVARVNLRLHPRDTPESVQQHFDAALADQEDITLKIVRGSNASRVSSTSAEGYQAIARTLRRVFGEIIAVPGITIGGTDSSHYGQVADDSYRIVPMLVSQDESSGFHGTNERISTVNLEKAVQFYFTLIQDL